MRRAAWTSVLILFAAAAPGGARAAEVVKLRPLPAIFVDAKGVGLKAPEGVGADGKSGLIVADTGAGRLVRFKVDKETTTPAGEIRLAELPVPIRVQVTSKGEIFVFDGKLRKVAHLGAEGDFKEYVDIGAAAAPRSLALDRDDNLYILDVGAGRVVVIGAAGGAQREIALPADAGFFSDLAVDARGTVFLIDSVGKRVYKAAKDARAATPLTESLKDELDFPTAIAVDDAGRLFVVDQNGGGLVILGPDGAFRGRQSSMGWKEGQLRYPTDVCLAAGGLLFVADRGNSRVQGFAISQ